MESWALKHIGQARLCANSADLQCAGRHFMRQDIMRVMCLLWRSLLCPHGLKACHDCIKAGPLRGRVGQAALRERPVGLRSVRRELQGLALHDDAVHDLRMLHAGPGPAAGHHLPQQHPKRIHVGSLNTGLDKLHGDKYGQACPLDIHKDC